MAPFPSFWLSRSHKFAIHLPCDCLVPVLANTEQPEDITLLFLVCFGLFCFFFPLQQNTPEGKQQRDERIHDTSGNVLFQLFPCSSATKFQPQRYRGDLSVVCCESSLTLNNLTIKKPLGRTWRCLQEMWELLGGHVPFSKLSGKKRSLFCAWTLRSLPRPPLLQKLIRASPSPSSVVKIRGFFPYKSFACSGLGSYCYEIHVSVLKPSGSQYLKQ